MRFYLRREWLEYAILILTLTLLLWLGPGRIWKHQIDHGYPYAYNAADAFQHQARAEGILKIGNYRYEPMEYLSGVYAEFPGYYPPSVSQLAALWAAFPGLESFHTTPGLVFISTLVSAALMYIIIRKFNRIVALLSLPLYLYLFSTPIAMRYFTWGHWPAIFGQLFIIFFVWALTEFDVRGSVFFVILSFTAMIMTYPAYLTPLGMLLAIFLGVRLLGGKLNARKIAWLGLAACLTLLITSKVFLIFLNFWLIQQPEKGVVTEWDGGGGFPAFAEFGMARWLIIFGIAVVAVIIFLNLRRKKETAILPLIFGLLMLFLGYANTIGFGKRAFLVRLYWPLYLSVFIGALLFYGGQLLLSHSKAKWSLPLASGIVTLLLVTLAFAVEKPQTGAGVMDSQLWEGITWLRDQTLPHTTFAVMYGDVFVGDMLWNLQRHHFLIDKEAYIEMLQNNSIKRYMLSSIGTNWYPFAVDPPDLHKENPVFWGWELNASLAQGTLVQERDICAWDYILFTKQSYQPMLVQYGQYIATLLLKKEWIDLAFQNDRVIILYNSKTGDACIEDQQIKQQ